MDARRQDLEDEVERARSDYLAVSRNGSLYADPEARDRAEERAWERLQQALHALDEVDAALSAGPTA